MNPLMSHPLLPLSPLSLLCQALYCLALGGTLSSMYGQTTSAYAYYYVDCRGTYRYSPDLAKRLLTSDTVMIDSALLDEEEFLIGKPILCIAHDRMAYFYDSLHHFFYFIPQIAKMDTDFINILIADRKVELWDYLRDSTHYHILFGYKNEKLEHNANYAIVHVQEGQIRKLLLFYDDKTIVWLRLSTIYRNAFGSDTSLD